MLEWLKYEWREILIVATLVAVLVVTVLVAIGSIKRDRACDTTCGNAPSERIKIAGPNCLCWKDGAWHPKEVVEEEG